MCCSRLVHSGRFQIRSTLGTRPGAAAAAAASSVRCASLLRRAMSAHITVPFTELDDGLTKLEQQPAPRYVVFTADPDPATGLPWCPDCVRAVPAVRRTMADRGAALLEVGVGQRADWKGNASHPCRTDSRFKVSGVPTLVHWPGGGEAGKKLGPELEAASSPQEAVALVAKFIMDTTETERQQ